MEDILCIYHGNCADGFGAAWSVWKKHPDAIFYAGMYGKTKPNCTGKNVYLVDFSYKADVLKEIVSEAKSVTIIDHHKTAKDDIQPLLDDGTINGIFDMAKSGAMLTWEWFHKGETPPRLIRHIQDRDLWKFELEKTREVQAAVFSYPYDFETWDWLMSYCDDDDGFQSLVNQGAAIERKHFKDIEELLSVSMREMNIGGYVVWSANIPYTLASDACHSMCGKGMIDPRDGYGELNPPVFAASYYDAKDGRIFSLRSVGDFDVSAIAKKYGGGGHKNAAGFKMPIGWEGDTP